ncbi:MAG: hypothetical protein ACKFIZ_00115 [Candidatus Hodgkinia cicadicola]
MAAEWAGVRESERGKVRWWIGGWMEVSKGSWGELWVSPNERKK